MLFDIEAYREAVINAFVHNLWITGNAPMFTVFQDRIEILSLGTMPPDQTLEGFFSGVSIPVNQKLSEIFLQLHISEKSGRGVPRITQTYGKKAFQFRDNAIAVTIPFDRLDLSTDFDEIPPVTGNNPPEIPPVAGENPLVDVSVAEKILQFCIEPKGIWEIADYLGYKDKKTVRKYLNPLIKRGSVVMTIPDKPNSSKQKYITIK